MPLAKLHLKATNLPDKDANPLRASDTSDAFFVVSFGDLEVYTSEVSNDNENPEWKIAEFEIPRHAQCGKPPKSILKIFVWRNFIGRHFVHTMLPCVQPSSQSRHLGPRLVHRSRFDRRSGNQVSMRRSSLQTQRL